MEVNAEVKAKTKFDYVLMLRRCIKPESFNKLVDKLEHELTGPDLLTFLSAVDHRRAEIIMGKFYDKVPREVWTYVK